MSIQIVGRKVGQTRKYHDDGSACAVTLIALPDNIVSQIKTLENDGYNAIQVSVGSKKLNKAIAGHLKKAKVASAKIIKEFRTEKLDQFTLGQPAPVEWLSKIKSVDVTGNSKGKGFAGVIKRHNFKTQDASHGNSLAHRAAGSIGQCQDPGKVFKGKKMAGRMGGVKTTQQNIKVVDFVADKALLVVKGAIPGAINEYVFIKASVKSGDDNE